MLSLMISAMLMLSTVLSVEANETSVQQKKTISGTVISASDSQPVIGASVVVDGTVNGTVTNIDGEFTLQVNSIV